MIVAENIRALMEKRGIKAGPLACEAGLNGGGVYDILSGRSRSPSIETLGKIAAALGVSTSALLEDRSSQDLKRDLIHVFEALPERERLLLLQTAQAWAEVRQRP